VRSYARQAIPVVHEPLLACQLDTSASRTRGSAIRREAKHRGWNLVDVCEDIASGKSVKRRPGLEAALASLAAGEGDLLVVSKLDRLSRSVRDRASCRVPASRTLRRRSGGSSCRLRVTVGMTTPREPVATGSRDGPGPAPGWRDRRMNEMTTERPLPNGSSNLP
jgi:hypothetical protein